MDGVGSGWTGWDPVGRGGIRLDGVGSGFAGWDPVLRDGIRFCGMGSGLSASPAHTHGPSFPVKPRPPPDQISQGPTPPDPTRPNAFRHQSRPARLPALSQHDLNKGRKETSRACDETLSVRVERVWGGEGWGGEGWEEARELVFARWAGRWLHALCIQSLCLRDEGKPRGNKEGVRAEGVGRRRVGARGAACAMHQREGLLKGSQQRQRQAIIESPNRTAVGGNSSGDNRKLLGRASDEPPPNASCES